VAGNHDLRRRIEIHRFNDTHRRCLGAYHPYRVVIEAENRGHATHADRHSRLHGLSAETDERHRVAERQRAGGDQRRVFAKAVAGHDRRRRAACHLPRAIDRIRGGQHNRLSIGGEVQVIRRAFGDQLAQILAERVGSFLNRLAHDRVIGKCVEHADRLRSLTRKNERKFHGILKIRCFRYVRHAALSTRLITAGGVDAPPDAAAFRSRADQ
jgi:hypothetical protein